MRIDVKLIILTILWLASAGLCIAEEPGDDLMICSVPKYGVRFACDHRWTVVENDWSTMFILSREPKIAIAFMEVDTEYKFVNQLTKDFFKSQKIYKDGFVVLNKEISGKPCLMVKAFYIENPDIRLNDYFFFHKGRLVRVFFSIEPKEAWRTFQFGIDRIMKSLEFIE